MRFTTYVYTFFIFCLLINFVFSYEISEVPNVSRKGLLLINILSKMLKSFNFTMVGEEMRLGSCSKASCLACHAITALYLSPFYTKEVMVSAVRAVCISFRLSSERVCRGMIESFMDDLDYIRRYTKLNRREICGILFGISCARIVTPNLSWTIAIPPPQYSNDIRRSLQYSNSEYTYDRADTIGLKTFIHLTDVHVDPYYTPESNTDCKEPLCCRVKDGISSNSEKKAGIWGDYGNCDLPINTIRNTLKHISQTHSDAEFLIWSGDNSPHDIWNTSREEILSNTRLITSLIKQYIKVPVFPVIGNHEGVPVNTFPPPEVKGLFSVSWLYHALAKEWAVWLPEDALKTLRYGGYYSVQVKPGLRVMALNTNYCTRLNPWTLYDPVDPGQQLKWLVNELYEAESSNERVHIIGHIPPDSRECTQAWLLNYLNIMDRFQNIIISQYFGHTHRDEFRLLYSPFQQSEAVSVAFIGPSLTPYTENNPAYQVYYIDSNNFLQDYTTFYFNLSEANIKKKPPNWKQGYSALESFKLTNFSPKSWHNLVERLKQDDYLFQSFHKVYFRWSEVKRFQTCYGRCKNNILDDLQVKHPLLTKPKRLFNSRNV